MRVGALFLAAMVLGGAGCGDQCGKGEARCEGNTAWECAGDGESGRGVRHWVRIEDCGERVCRSTGTEAFCSLGPEPDPACGAASGTICDGRRRIGCAAGYLVGVVEECTDPALCDGTACLAVGARHPACVALEEPTTSVRTTCFRNHVLLCREGRLRVLTDCGERRCVRTDPPAGAQWCEDGKCVPYFDEPLAACR